MAVLSTVVIRSTGAHSNACQGRVSTTAGHACSWVLKSAPNCSILPVEKSLLDQRLRRSGIRHIEIV